MVLTPAHYPECAQLHFLNHQQSKLPSTKLSQPQFQEAVYKGAGRELVGRALGQLFGK